MLELIESVKKHGVLVPAIARPKPDGGYELVAGHRRQRASQLAGLDSIPVIVMNLDDNDTIIQLVDSNIQREKILPSERAKAYKLRMEAVKKKAGRPQKEEDQNSPKISANFRSDDSIGELAGVSGDTIRNYISLRIRDKGSLQGTIVPVWDFWGTWDWYEPGDGASDTMRKGASYTTQPMLTLNAIDGNVVNRQLGY